VDDIINWTPELIGRLRELRIEGHNTASMVEILSRECGFNFTYKKIDCALDRYGLRGLIENDDGIKLYKEMTLPEGNYIVSCDYHAPYFSEAWVNRLLLIAQRFNIKKHIIAGDLFDMNFAKWQTIIDGDHDTDLDEETISTEPLIKALDWFNDTFLICGNHETRLSRITDARIQMKHIIRYIGEGFGGKLRFSEYDKVNIGDKWLVVHPKSYSQISASVAVRLAEKYHRHVLNAHGHFIALRFDRSGKYMGVDLGGMFAQDKIGYCSLSTTTHPFWNNGFGAIINGYFYHFHEGTDWKFWFDRPEKSDIAIEPAKEAEEVDYSAMDYGESL